ncbi:MAG: calcium/sodium antiporter [Firmicutes bacterium]|nr:calcium/sodium antiporter [Bacillota bacterium]MBR6798714.1 calcium/sodium antiporter [Bacillota bacterium]
MAYILLIIGFIFLVKGADLFVSGSSAIAENFGIPTFIIGLTVVAFGTSMPEAAISVTAAVTGANGIAVGNAIGSNIFNLLVVLGASSLIKECPVSRDTLRFEYPLSIATAGVLLVMGLRAGADGSLFGTGIVSRVDGLVLLAVFTVFMVMTVKKAMKQHNRENIIDYYGGADVGDPGACMMEEDGELICDEDEKEDDPDNDRELSSVRASIKSIIGLAGIVLGGDLVVESAVTIAEAFGIDEILIGLTIVALGTSLPELVISIVAAVKGETDIAVGNVIGSNIFNILLVLGLSTTIHPIAITMFSIYDILILIGASLIVLIPLARKQVITRGWGVLLLLMYAGYLAYIIMRTI